MIPYYFTLSILFLSIVTDFLRSKHLKLAGLIVSFPMILLLVGLRDETGSDWKFYEAHYNLLLRGLDGAAYDFEIGYRFFGGLISLFRFNFNWFIFVYTAALLTIAFALSWTLPRPNTFIFLFFSLFLIEMMGTLRQMVAVVLIASASNYLGNNRGIRRKISFCARVIIASSFHTSAIVMLWLGKFANIDILRKSIKLFLLLLAGAFAIVVLFYPDLLIKSVASSDYLRTKLTAYILSSSNTPIYYTDDLFVKFRIFTYRLMMLALAYFLLRSEPWNQRMSRFFKIDATGFLIFTLLYFTFPPIAVRLGVYFTFFELLLFSSFRRVTVTSISCLGAVLVLCSLNFHLTLIGPDADLLVPYKGVWFNSRDVRILR